MHRSKVIATFRPPFLLLTPICVALGLALAMFNATETDYLLVVVALVGALSAHISVNTLNEYFDFKSGLDLQTTKTPFSGGSGALPEHPELAWLTLIIGLVTLLFTVLVGGYFIHRLGMIIFPIGLLGVMIILTYTQWLNRNPVLCLLSAGLGFGFLMVVGTYVVLAGSYHNLAWWVALVPFLLVNNLLLLNQYPDMQADRAVGRRTFPIVFGITASNLVYALFMVAAYGVVLVLVQQKLLPTFSLIALIPAFLALFSLAGAIKYGEDIAQVPKFMAANVAAALLTPLLLAVSLVIS
ncbi:prenyltransferase [Colwellia sp. BRX10-3]|uniref:prenyltransferase n=1 Tax=Colwellia sp. BRX10-3 TaxID=2759844 RepID=UPI0015F36892|nr:prenyltransferase [Colwellia sp. BRX10-3]MBA6390297.1 prenyltransferase [Colwellia sp. BRX10-3]